jgi:hypothetical protein
MCKCSCEHVTLTGLFPKSDFSSMTEHFYWESPYVHSRSFTLTGAVPLHMPKISLLIPPVEVMDFEEKVLRFALLHKRIYNRPTLSYSVSRANSWFQGIQVVLVIKLLIEIEYIFFTIIICLSTTESFFIFMNTALNRPCLKLGRYSSGLGTHSLAPWFEIHPPLDFHTSSHWLTLP